MEAKELRIGNYVKDPYNKTIKLFNVDSDASMLRPIPLTEEWLLKFGFESDRPSSINQFTLCDHSKGEVLFQLCGNEKYEWYRPHDTFPKIKQGNQLQNLYFALTGKELEIKEHESKLG